MQNDIYKEAIIDATKLRDEATKVANKKILETFAPQVKRYVEQVLLEDEASPDDEENILTDATLDDESHVMPERDPSLPGDIAGDVEDAMAAAAVDSTAIDNQTGISMNDDGTWTLDLDSMIVPDDASSPDVVPAPEVAPDDILGDVDVHEAIVSLDRLMMLSESIGNKSKEYDYAITLYRRAFRDITSDKSASSCPSRHVTRALTELAKRVSKTYVEVRDDSSLTQHTAASHARKLDRLYVNTSNLLVRAITERINRELGKYRREFATLKQISESLRKKKTARIIDKINGLNTILEAIVDRVSVTDTRRLKSRMTSLVEEIEQMTNKKRRSLRETDDVVLRLTFDDDAAADELRSALGTSDIDVEDDVDAPEIDAVEADEDVDVDEADEAPAAAEADLDENTIARRLSRLFEADETDDDEPAEEPEEADDVADVEEAEEAEEAEEDDGGDVADAFKSVADSFASGDVTIELVDDLDASAVNVQDDFGEDFADFDVQDDMGDMGDMGDVDDDMRVTESRIRRHRMRARHRMLIEQRRRNRLAQSRHEHREARASTHEVSKLRRALDESKKKHTESNLFATKLLYVNKLLREAKLTANQQEKVIKAIDKARSLREVQLLYRNVSRAIAGRTGRTARLTEGSGSSSRVTTSGGLSSAAQRHPREKHAIVQSDNSDLLNENIDVDMWRKHAGLLD